MHVTVVSLKFFVKWCGMSWFSVATGLLFVLLLVPVALGVSGDRGTVRLWWFSAGLMSPKMSFTGSGPGSVCSLLRGVLMPLEGCAGGGWLLLLVCCCCGEAAAPEEASEDAPVACAFESVAISWDSWLLLLVIGIAGCPLLAAWWWLLLLLFCWPAAVALLHNCCGSVDAAEVEVEEEEDEEGGFMVGVPHSKGLLLVAWCFSLG